MATGFHSLCHNSICATADHKFCHSYTCYYRNYFNTCFFPEAHEFGWISGSCCDNRNLLLNLLLLQFWKRRKSLKLKRRKKRHPR